MSFGSRTESLLQELKGYISSDGSILDNWKEKATELVPELKELTGVDISIIDVENPETHEIEQKIQAASYTNLDTGEIVPAAIYNSPNELYDGVTAAGEFKTQTEYFNDTDIYVGCLSHLAGSGEKLARALTFASGANLKYSHTVHTDGSNVYYLRCPNFYIEIKEAKDESSQVSIKLVVTTQIGEPDAISPFNDALGSKFIQYYIRRGSSGDCYLKGVYTDDPIAPDISTAETAFADVTMNVFTGYSSGTVQKSGAYGGFALVAMDDKVSGGSDEASYSASENRNYAFVLWRNNGTPFHIGYTYTVSKFNEDYASMSWNRIITNSDDQVVALAPIFNPGSGQAASADSMWSMIISKEGTYALSVGNGGTYFYDHGFALRSD